jgi:sugar phosphate isomerase/epimerase
MNKLAICATSLRDTPPLEYVDAVGKAGFDAVGIRLYPSPTGMPYFPVVGNSALIRDIKHSLENSGLSVLDIQTFYVRPDIDHDAMRLSLELGAELGAQYALIIGDDPDWPRMCDGFGRLCETVTACGLVPALEAPVIWQINTLPKALKLIADSGRTDSVICIDQLLYFRAGHSVDMLREVPSGIIAYSQFADGRETGERCFPGEGSAPLGEILDALPAGQPLSLEFSAPAGSRYSAAEWASLMLEHSRRFLADYYARQAEQPVAG